MSTSPLSRHYGANLTKRYLPVEALEKFLNKYTVLNQLRLSQQCQGLKRVTETTASDLFFCDNEDHWNPRNASTNIPAPSVDPIPTRAQGPHVK